MGEGGFLDDFIDTGGEDQSEILRESVTGRYVSVLERTSG